MFFAIGFNQMHFSSTQRIKLLPLGLANLAQLVEQLIRNEQVAGSIPAVGSKLKFILSNLVTTPNDSSVSLKNYLRKWYFFKILLDFQ